jgi:hypothetical protein
MALNCCELPGLMEGFGGVTTIEVRLRGELFTVKSVLPLRFPLVAVIIAVPAATL